MKSLAEAATAAGLFAAKMLESSLNANDYHHHHHHHYTDPLTKPDCALCKGRGFVHHSSMSHDELPDQKCFWCKECPSCAGSCVMEHNEVSCRRCKGHGFIHNSSIRHEKAPDQMCFHCKKCKICHGTGKTVVEIHGLSQNAR